MLNLTFYCIVCSKELLSRLELLVCFSAILNFKNFKRQISLVFHKVFQVKVIVMTDFWKLFISLKYFLQLLTDWSIFHLFSSSYHDYQM